MGLQGERPMVESTGDPESGRMQESGGGQEVELLRFPLLLNQGNARTVKGSQGSTGTEELQVRGLARSALQGANAWEHAGNAGGPAICHYHPFLHLSLMNIHIRLLYTAVAMAKTVKR